MGMFVQPAFLAGLHASIATEAVLRAPQRMNNPEVLD
jgi:hypothetical protein